MRIKQRAMELLFCLLTGTLYCYGLTLSIFAATVIPVAPLFLLGVCAGAILAFCAIFFNRYTFLTALIVACIAMGWAYYTLRRGEYTAQWFTSLTDHLYELTLFFAHAVPYKESFGKSFALGVSLLIAMVAVLNIHVRYSFVLLLLFSLGIVVVPIYMDWGSSDAGMLLLLFSLLVFLCKRLNLFAMGKGLVRNTGFSLLFALPVCLVATLVSLVLPKPQWDPDLSDTSIYNRVSGTFESLGANRVRTFSDFGERLGGPNLMGNEEVMRVRADERVYLRGIVRDTYTGYSWVLSDSHRQELTPTGDSYGITEYPQELAETQKYYMRYYGREVKTLSVDVGDNRTRTVFTPPFAETLLLPEASTLRQSTLGALQADKPLRRQTVYQETYISWAYDNTYFISLMQGMPAAETSHPDLAPFLQLPDSLPERVPALARQLTEGHTNTYDRVRALEAHLAAFPYTLLPDAVPRDADFVDYFLFEGKEGYCTYYASALAVMARSVGIPSRYVEGFVMPPATDGSGVYVVTAAQAHAWVEIWFPGFGWVQFEPTAPNYQQLYGGANLAQELPDALPEPDHTDDVADPLPDGTAPDVPEPDVPDGTPAPLPTTPGEGEEEEAGRSMPGWLLAIPLILVIAAVPVLLVRMRVQGAKRKLKQIDTLPNNEAAVAYYSRLLRATTAYGYPILDNETAYTYAQRVQGKCTFSRQSVTLTDLADIYSKAAYSDNPVTDREKSRLKRSYYEMLDKLKGTGINGVRYWLNRYVFMRY